MLPAGQASPSEVFLGLLERRAPAFGLRLAAASLEKLASFLAELDSARRHTNLTGPLTAAQLVDHALESALGERLIPHGVQVVDIGSGAGFPGLPLALVRPDLSVTALEPRRKRAEFLRHVLRAVPVENAIVREARASDLAEKSFDVATSRAVGDLPQVIGEAGFVKSGGVFLVWTTEPQKLANSLTPLLALERIERVPDSRRRVIALYSKAPASPT
jgi:16S rRNA (guanine(527)-N(7))-methyltransferase RsmG